jgi:hypothetical protein
MTCSSKLYGGQKKNKQQRKPASQRKRVGGQEPNTQEPLNTEEPKPPAAPVNTDESTKPAAPVSEIVAETGDVLKNVAEKVENNTNTNVPTESQDKSAVAPPSVFSFGNVSLGKIFGFGGKRKTQAKQNKRRQRKTQKAGNQKTIIGRIYSKTCIHCIKMEQAWKKLDKMIKQRRGNIEIKNVEASEMGQQLPVLNQRFLGGSDKQLEIQGGFPTLFKIKDNQVEYYGGERTAEAMFDWASR